MKHMMVDLETLGTSANSVVVSVGAAVFDGDKGVTDKGYWVLDIQEQLNAGRKISGDTIKWWMRQSEEARRVFATPSEKVVSLKTFALEFEALFDGPTSLWGNGSDFDLSIMVDLWNRHKLKEIPHWKYYNHMCYRTFAKMTGCKGIVARSGTHHNALDDAIHQAECAIASGKL